MRSPRLNHQHEATGRVSPDGDSADGSFDVELEALYLERLAHLLSEMRWLAVEVGWTGDQLVTDHSVRRNVRRLEGRLYRALAIVHEDQFTRPSARGETDPPDVSEEQA